MHTKEANKKIISIEADESFDAHTFIDEITQLGHMLWLCDAHWNATCKASRYFSFSMKLKHFFPFVIHRAPVHLSDVQRVSIFSTGLLIVMRRALVIYLREWRARQREI